MELVRESPTRWRGRTIDNARQNASAPSASLFAAPSIVHGLFLGEAASEDGWQPLPTPAVVSVAELCEQEERLRCRYQLLPPGFYEPIQRADGHCDASGASQAVRIEAENLRHRQRDADVENVSIG